MGGGGGSGSCETNDILLPLCDCRDLLAGAGVLPCPGPKGLARGLGYRVDGPVGSQRNQSRDGWGVGGGQAGRGVGGRQPPGAPVRPEASRLGFGTSG